MSNRSRAERRHHRNRLIAKRLRQNSRYGVGLPNESEWRIMNAKVRARTGTLCSCYMCCNVRGKYGNGRAALTFQELVALDHLNER